MNRIAVLICTGLVIASSCYAAVVTLPNTSQSTTFTANVAEQANVAVPAAVAWTVNNVSVSTASAAQTVSASTIVLADGKKLRIEIAPDATDFTAPAGGTVTWASDAVSWVSTWTNATENDATMSASANTYVKVADMTAVNTGSMGTVDLVFTLAAKATVDRAGAHTLACTWKFSSF